MLVRTLYNEALFVKLSKESKETSKPKPVSTPSWLSGAAALAQEAAKKVKDGAKVEAKRGISKTRDEESVPSRIGLTSKRFTVPQFLASHKPLPNVTDEEKAKALLSAGGMGSLTSGPKSYLTPQNVTRAAMLGGTVAGGVSGGNSLKSWGAGLGGSVGGALVGGYASEGLNRAIDAYYGIPRGSEKGLTRRIVSDVLLPSAGAVTGGYFAGRATR